MGWIYKYIIWNFLCEIVLKKKTKYLCIIILFLFYVSFCLHHRQNLNLKITVIIRSFLTIIKAYYNKNLNYLIKAQLSKWKTVNDKWWINLPWAPNGFGFLHGSWWTGRRSSRRAGRQRHRIMNGLYRRTRWCWHTNHKRRHRIHLFKAVSQMGHQFGTQVNVDAWSRSQTTRHFLGAFGEAGPKPVSFHGRIGGQFLLMF